jgi:putative transposase
MSKFNRKYRSETTRLPNWDYASAGWYFVTLCTQDNKPFFGKIIESKTHMSPMGNIVAEEWIRTETIRQNDRLDEWIIMPNHLHGIIILEVKIPQQEGSKTPQRGVSTGDYAWKANTLGSIINQIKGACTRRIRQAGYPEFSWQPRFYDHIIRSQASVQRIRRYISQNPAKWQQDQYHPSNLNPPT